MERRVITRIEPTRRAHGLTPINLFALLAVLALVACAGTAFAGLSDDEIVALMGRVQEEVVVRHIEGTATLAGGVYIAGRDTPAGSYVFTSLASGDEWGNVTIYSEKGEGDQLFWEAVSAPEEGGNPECSPAGYGRSD